MNAALFEELHNLIHAQIEGRLTDDQTRRLDELVRTSDDACQLYVKYIEETVALKWWAERVPETNERAFAQQILMEAVEEDMKAKAAREIIKAAEEKAAQQLESERQQSLRVLSGYSKPVKQVRHYVIPTWAAYGTAAAIVAVLIAVIYPMFSYKQKPNNGTDPVQPPFEIVATFERENNAIWVGDTNVPRINQPMLAGRQILNSGIAYVRMNDGALVAIEGPATFDLQTDSQMKLHRGRIAAVVPRRAIGFTVFTPSAKVVDLGTEFGVEVNPAQDTEIHVFHGKVKAGVASGATLTDLRAFQAARIDNQRKHLSLFDMDTEQFVNALPHLALLNKNLVENGGFEDGPHATIREKPEGRFNSKLTNEDIPHWNDGQEDSLATVVSYDLGGPAGFPSGVKGDWLPYESERGEQFFAGRTAGVTWQEIAIHELAAHIDADIVKIDTSAWLGGLNDQNDRIDVFFRYLDADSREIGHVQIPAVTARDRDNETGFMIRKKEGKVPRGTRTIRIELKTHEDVWISDGYADDIRMELLLEDG